MLTASRSVLVRLNQSERNLLLRMTLIKALFSAFFIGLFFSSAANADNCVAPHQAVTAQIKHLADGDSFTLTNKQKVRILGIDAYERQQSPWADLARNQVQRLIGSSQLVQLQQQTGKSKDTYKRQLAHVFVGKTNVGESLLKQGYAFPLMFLPYDSWQSCYLTWVKRAEKAKKGVWQQLEWHTPQSLYPMIKAKKNPEYWRYWVQAKIQKVTVNPKIILVQLEQGLILMRPENYQAFKSQFDRVFASKLIRFRAKAKKSGKQLKFWVNHLADLHPSQY